MIFRPQCVDCDQLEDNEHILRNEEIVSSVDKAKSENKPELPACTDLLVTDNTGSIMDNILSAGVLHDSGYVTSDSEDNNIINTEDSYQIVNYFHNIKTERIASRFVF